jgi:hypothetical protein
MENIEEIILCLKSAGCELIPCTKSDVLLIEEYYQVKLPTVYKEFLLSMGKGAGAFMRGSSVFFDEIFDLKDGAEELIRDNDLGPMPGDAFVFWMHQGYQIAFFRLSEDEELPIYYFSEGTEINKFVLKTKNFVAFLEIQLRMSGII